MPKRILIADDQLPARELLKAILSNTDYEVIEVCDGHAALREAAACLPDLVLLDIQMPGRDGFAVCMALRGDPRFARTPIVAMTAGLMRGERERALAAGFTEFLGKPMSVAVVRNLVEGLLRPVPEPDRA